MFTASGLLVRYLKVFEKSGGKSTTLRCLDSHSGIRTLTHSGNSIKWVRYLTRAQGSYFVRVSLQLYTTFLELTCSSEVEASTRDPQDLILASASSRQDKHLCRLHGGHGLLIPFIRSLYPSTICIMSSARSFRGVDWSQGVTTKLFGSPCAITALCPSQQFSTL